MTSSRIVRPSAAAFFSFALLVAIAEPVRANVTYRPGLTQVLFELGSPNGFATSVSAVPTLASNIVAAAAADSHADTRVERVPYPLMDSANNVVNPVTGSTWSWPDNHATFAYEGEIHVTAGTTYTIYGRFDDGSAMVLDGSLVLLQREDSGWNKQPQVWGGWTASRTGWVPFNGWIWDWAGGKATRDCAYALQYNTSGEQNSFTDTTKWSRFLDDGSMTFLRTDTGETFTTIVSADSSGDDLVLNVSFANVPASSTLVAYFGDGDGGTSSAGWDSSVSLGTIAAGNTAAAPFTVTGAATANYLRLCLSNPTKASGDNALATVFEEWTEPVDRDPAPAVSLSLSSISYTNAVYEAQISSFGFGSTSCDLVLEISRSASFDPVDIAVSTSGVDSASVVFPISGLVTNTVYYARVTGTNDKQKSGVSSTVSSKTLKPGAPMCAAGSVVRGFTTLAVSGKATAFGEGATSATMRLEASTDASFATLVGVSEEIPAALGETATFEIGNLALATEYRLRLRIVNDWGVESIEEVPATRTIDGPFDATGISWKFSEDVTEVSVSLNVTAIFAESSGTAVLYCDEGAVPTVSYGERTVDAVGTVSWADIPFGDEPLNAKVVLASEVAGVTYTQTWTAVVDLSVKRPKRIPVEDGLAVWENGEGVDGSIFDGNFETGFRNVTEDAAIVVDFTSLFDPNDQNQRMYVGDILVAHGIANPYSLFLSEDGTTWTPVEDAQNVSGTGSASYSVKTLVSKIKYVFGASYTSHAAPVLSELQVYGYLSDSPHIVSTWQQAWIYKKDGTPCDKDSSYPTQPAATGGGSLMKDLFNGNFSDNVYIGPNGRLNNGSYCLLDFSGAKPGGWYVTEIKTGSTSTHKYSLYYSVDGKDWTLVDNAYQVAAVGQKTFPVNDKAVYVKCVFDEIGGWTPSFCELQVWGMDPDDVPCMHPYWTAWAPVEGSATCLAAGIDEQFCTVCGERVTRESTTLGMLGHDYVCTLDRPGKYKAFGQGFVSCSRCDYRFECPEPIDLITNRVDGARIGDIRTAGFDHFTEVEASSTGQTEYGVRPGHLIGDNWTWSWNSYWFSIGNNTDPNPRVDYEFGTEIDLVYIDVSLPNATHSTRFFSVDDSTGEEVQLEEFLIERTDIEKGDKYHIQGESGSEGYVDIYEENVFDELPVVKDDRILNRKFDDNGIEIEGEAGNNGYNQYQRFLVRFYEQPIRHLRIRQYNEDGSVKKTMEISELHPWGTVRGAGDLRYRKETLMILR